MIKQSDVQGRLRLLRYGLIVVVVVTFLVAWLAPYAFVTSVKPEGQDRTFADASGAKVGIDEFLVEALIATLVVAVIAVVIYFAYSYVLKRTLAKSSETVAPIESAG